MWLWGKETSKNSVRCRCRRLRLFIRATPRATHAPKVSSLIARSQSLKSLGAAGRWQKVSVESHPGVCTEILHLGVKLDQNKALPCQTYLNFDGRCITYRDGSWAALGHGLSWATDLNFRLREGHRHPAKVFEDFCCQELLPLVWQRVGRSHLLIPDVTLPFCLDMTWTHMFNFFHYRLSSILKVTNKVWRAIKKLQRQNMTK